jgi:hypothetical protein
VTTAEVAVRDPRTLEAKIEYARFLAKAELLPKAFRDQPANILFAAEYGELLGLHPMAAITGINIIDGKPSISAGLISALVRRAGHRLRLTGDAAKASCQIIRADDPGFVYKADWDMDRAKTAGLMHKSNWQHYPAAMLKARAVSECARDACQEVLLGIAYTPDELGADDDGGEVIHDGWPTLPNGQLDQTQMSEQAKDQAGMMPRHQRVEHDELRDMNKVNPADLEHVHEEPDKSDPWQMPPPPGPKSPVAPEAWQKNLAKLMKPIPLGTDEDRAVILGWLTSRPVDVADPQFTRAEVKLVADIVRSHLETAQGETELAASKLWEQYHNAQEATDEDI